MIKIWTLLAGLFRVTPLIYLFGLNLIIVPCYPSVIALSEESMGIKEGHCSMSQGTVDGKTLACMVWDNDPARFSEPTQIEIYRDHKLKYTIQSGSPIWEWHFWKEGKQLAIHYGSQNGAEFYVLYDSRTGKEVDRLADLMGSGHLPEWAKSQWVRDKESLPVGPAFLAQQAIWTSKILEQINTIHVGMTRKDLLTVFNEDGGISTRIHETFVYKGCPNIKVDVDFSPAGGANKQYNNEDRIVSISRPYLAYEVMD